MNKKQGGRPPLKESQKRKYLLCLKLTTVEHYTLKSRAKEAGISKSEFARQAINNGKVRGRMTVEMAELIRKICGMANNLNQITRKANAAGYAAVRSEYLHLAEMIDDIIKRAKR